MAPVNPNNTDRYFFDYDADGRPHTVMMRTLATIDPVEAVAGFAGFVAALSPLMCASTLTGARFAEQGSNVTNPVSIGGGVSWGAGGQNDTLEPAFISFVGRDNLGRRARVFMYGVLGVNQADYRLTFPESDEVIDVVGYLSSAAGIFLTITLGVPVWKNYANLGFNAYWQRQARILGA